MLKQWRENESLRFHIQTQLNLPQLEFQMLEPVLHLEFYLPEKQEIKHTQFQHKAKDFFFFFLGELWQSHIVINVKDIQLIDKHLNENNEEPFIVGDNNN